MPWVKSIDDRMWQVPDNFNMNNLESIQLALHSNDIRPPYKYWETMLQRSPDLEHLSLHYSGPKKQDNADPASIWPPSPLSSLPPGELEVHKPRVVSLPCLRRLSFTDLEEDRYACDILERMLCENLAVLKLGTMEDLEPGADDFTELVELIIGTKTPNFCASPSPSNQTEFRPRFVKCSPFPNIQNLHTLTLASFGCSYSSFEALMRCLVGLKVIGLDFHRLNLTEGTAPRDAWELFAAQTNHHSAVLLPQLECFAIQGLSGLHVREIISSRFRVSHFTREQSPVHENGPVQITMPRYVISVAGKERARDPILDAMIKDGSTTVQTSSSENVERVPVEVKITLDIEEAEDEDEDDDDDDDDDDED